MNLPVYFDHFLLTNTMATSLGLEIVLGIPVTVINDDSISSRQIDTQTTSFSAKQENETIRIWFAITIDCSLSHVTTNTTIKSFVRVFPRNMKMQT